MYLKTDSSAPARNEREYRSRRRRIPGDGVRFVSGGGGEDLIFPARMVADSPATGKKLGSVMGRLIRCARLAMLRPKPSRGPIKVAHNICGPLGYFY